MQSICRVRSEMRFGSVVGDGAFRIYSEAFREISQDAFLPAMQAGDARLDRIAGDAGQVSVHYLYSWQSNPGLVALRDALQRRR
jgi:hypothetical protein